MIFEAIILDSEGVEIVGPTIYDGDPRQGLRIAVAPRRINWSNVDPSPLDGPLIMRAECERRRGDGVYIFRRVGDFRPAPAPSPDTGETP